MIDTHSKSTTEGRRVLLFVANESYAFVSHRLAVAAAARDDGWEVHVLVHEDETSSRISEAGVTFWPWAIEPRGRSPISDLKAFWQLLSLVRRVRPTLMHVVTIKAVLYGGLAARLLRVPSVVYAIAGLGTLFSGHHRKGRWLRRLVQWPYRVAAHHGSRGFIFQNATDRENFHSMVGLDGAIVVDIPGMGVDLDQWHECPETDAPLTALLVTRLLEDKGVNEYCEAAAMVPCNSQYRFLIAGGRAAEGNPAALSPSDICSLEERFPVRFLGHRDDVFDLVSNAHVVVLPSWREGFPRVLIEAAAVGRAVVTTDVPGCRDAVVANETGLVVPVRDPASLATAMHTLLSDTELRRTFGHAGRLLAEQRYDVRDVCVQHLSLYQHMNGRFDPPANGQSKATRNTDAPAHGSTTAAHGVDSSTENRYKSTTGVKT